MKPGEIKSHDSIQENRNGTEGIFLRRTFSQCLSKFQNPAEVSAEIAQQVVLPAGFVWGDLHTAGRGSAEAFALVINDKMEIVCDELTLSSAIKAAEAAGEDGLVEFLKRDA